MHKTDTHAPEQLLRAKRVAERYDVAERTIRQWLRDGDPRLPPPVAAGSRFLRWRAVDVDRAIRRMAASAA